MDMDTISVDQNDGNCHLWDFSHTVPMHLHPSVRSPVLPNPQFDAPEVYLHHQTHNSQARPSYDQEKADVWALGIVFHRMLSHGATTLFSQSSTADPIYRTYQQTGNIETILQAQNVYVADPDAVDLLHQMLRIDPSHRFTVAQILLHPYFAPLGQDGDLEKPKNSLAKRTLEIFKSIRRPISSKVSPELAAIK